MLRTLRCFTSTTCIHTYACPHLDGVAPLVIAHLPEDIEGRLQAVLLELSKLPGPAIVVPGAPHPDTAAVVQHILVQVRLSGVVTAVICGEIILLHDGAL